MSSNLVALLRELQIEMRHALTFIRSREKMHPVGVEQYEDALRRLGEHLDNAPAEPRYTAQMRCPRCAHSADVVIFDSGPVPRAVETSAPLLGMDTPWPLHETVAKLIQATEHLLGHHQCDVHGHEEFRTAANRAKEYLAALRSPETPVHRKWPGEPPHCPSCSCGAPAAALRRYIVEQLGFLSDDDNCPAERFIRLAVAKLRAPETSAPQKDWPTLAVESWEKNHPPLDTSIAEQMPRRALEVSLARHVKWRETALGFFHQILDGRGTEDEWPALAEFVKNSETVLRPAEKAKARHDDTCPALKSIGTGPCVCGAESEEANRG
jgi:hypothetical protein